MNQYEVLRSALDKKPLFEVNNYNFILNPLTEQVPATTSQLLEEAATALIDCMKISDYDKLITEEDILKYALVLEQKSIDLYSELIQQLADPDLSHQIKKVLAEENNHFENIVGILELQKSSAKDPLMDAKEAELKLKEALDKDERQKG